MARLPDENAMIELAQYYLHENSEKDNLEKAFYWMSQAAKFKTKFVQANLGGIYRYGTGCEIMKKRQKMDTYMRLRKSVN